MQPQHDIMYNDKMSKKFDNTKQSGICMFLFFLEQLLLVHCTLDTQIFMHPWHPCNTHCSNGSLLSETPLTEKQKSRAGLAYFYSFWSNFYQYIVLWTLKSSCAPGIHATHIVVTVVCLVKNWRLLQYISVIWTLQSTYITYITYFM